MTNTTEITIFVKQDTYISSDAPDKNEDTFPLLNVGRSENNSLNRVLIQGDFVNLNGVVEEAKLCLFQIYNGIYAKSTDILYLHEVSTQWTEETATWNEVGTSPLGNLVSTASFSTEEDIKVCFDLDPSRISGNRFGYILKGEEDLEKHDRWFRSSEYISDSKQVYNEAYSDVYHPHFVLKIGPFKPKEGAPIGLIIGITIGSLSLILFAGIALMTMRRRRQRRLEEEESSSESEVEEKDFVDNLGEMFGVVSSSDDEETFNTRGTTVYDGESAIEVQRYNRRPLFGARDEEETYITDDSSYISRWYRNNRG